MNTLHLQYARVSIKKNDNKKSPLPCSPDDFNSAPNIITRRIPNTHEPHQRQAIHLSIHHLLHLARRTLIDVDLNPIQRLPAQRKDALALARPLRLERRNLPQNPIVKRHGRAIRAERLAARGEEHVRGAFDEHQRVPPFVLLVVVVTQVHAVAHDGEHPFVLRVERDFEELVVRGDQGGGVEAAVALREGFGEAEDGCVCCVALDHFLPRGRGVV